MSNTFTTVAAVAALSLLLVGSAAAAGAQTWYTTASASNTLSTTPSTGSAFVQDGTARTWTAMPAEVDVEFGTDSWTYTLVINTNFTGKYRVALAKTTTSGLQIIAETGDLSTAGTHTGTLTPASSFTVNQGESLSFRINNLPDTGVRANKDKNVHMNVATSTLVSPASDPGYPTPELTTLALAGLGMIGLVAIAARRK